MAVIMPGMGLSLQPVHFRQIIIAAKSARLVGPQVRTIVIEVSIQNGTLGIAVASTLIGNNTMAIPAAVYSLIMFVTGTMIIFWGNIRK